MKPRNFIFGLLFVLAMLVACMPNNNDGPVETRLIASPNAACPNLTSIDSLMWRQPDSALALLLPYFDTCCRDVSRNVSRIPNVLGDVSGNVSTTTEYDNHYAHLLLAELLYKNDYEQTNRRDLQKAVCYFDSLCCRNVARRLSTDPAIAFLDARAHYINGVGYYEKDSVVEACKEYMKALEVMEERFEEKELVGKKGLFMAFTYTRLTDLFSDLYLHEQTIYYAKLSLPYYQKQNVFSWYFASMLNEIGSQYDMMKQLDSAKCYYKKAVDASKDTTTLLYRDITAHLVYMEYKEGSCMADSSIIKFSQLIQSAESDRESQARYLNLGEVLYHEQKYDSAWFYLNKVYHETPSIGMKKQVAEWLVEIGKAKGKEVHDYTGFLVPFANLEENTSEIKSQLTELYKAFCQVQQERHHQSEMRRHRNWSIMVVAGLSSLIIIVLALYYNKKRQKKHLENQINDEKQAHNLEKKALSGRLKKSNETLRELQDQINQQNRNSFLQAETPTATFMDEPICRLILERVREGQFKSQMNCTIYRNYALSKDQLITLQDAANRHFNRFTERLAQTYPDLTKSDLDYCCLYLLGLTDADVSALMQRAYNTVNERNSKLKKILGCNKNVSAALFAIANDQILD